jgi:L-asparaginase
VKRILIIHTGGTFGMGSTRPSRTLSPGELAVELETHVPELQRIAAVETAVAFSIDSSNMTLRHWRVLATLVAEARERYDGFVVIHGTDTMAYTATALSFMLQGLSRPVILTGSQRPLIETRSDARSNLVGAVEIATTDLAEVGVFFGTHLYRGNRTTKVSADRYDAFASPNYPPLAETGVDLTLSGVARRVVAGEVFHLHAALDPSLVVVSVHPGMPRGFLERALQGDERAFIVRGYGPGNVPIEEESFLPFVERALQLGKIVAMHTQCAEGRVSLDLYECGRKTADLGAWSCGDMTLESSIVKMMYLLGRAGTREEMARAYVTNLVGELTPVAA